ncbi:MAG: GxxExxY protein [Bacteroidetes bacterium]|nr:MAG: GxxExxY protein [Bacteroidota bacterium]
MKYEEITYKIIACAMEVHKKLGPGYPEYIYHRALIIEFKLQCVVFEDEFEIKIYYKGEQVGIRRVDFLVEKIVPVEIKAASELSDINIAQAKNYVEASGIEIGLLINFGAASLQFKRMINNRSMYP